MRPTRHVHHPLAAMIALSLCIPPFASAQAAESACDTELDSTCKEEDGASRGFSPWWIGGIAALVAGAAAGGGGGGGGDGNTGGGNNGGDSGGNGGGTSSGMEGGQYGNNQTVVSSGGEARWEQAVDTSVLGSVRNDGTLLLNAGSLSIHNDGHLQNYGVLRVSERARVVIHDDGDFDNRGQFELYGAMSLQPDASFDNYVVVRSQGASIGLVGDADVENLGSMDLRDTLVTLQGESEFDNGERRRDAQLSVDGGGFLLGGRSEFDNHGSIIANGALHQGALVTAVSAQVGNDRDSIEAFNNRGDVQMLADAGVLHLQADSHASNGINRVDGQITSHARDHAALHAEGAYATLLNQGTLTVTGDNAVAMSGTRGATLLNDGTINLGVAGGNNGQHMVAMQSDGSATLNNRRTGVINIHANNSHAFRMGAGGGGRLINNGVVNVYGTGAGLHADAAT